MIEKIKLNEFKTTYKNNLLFFNIYFIYFLLFISFHFFSQFFFPHIFKTKHSIRLCLAPKFFFKESILKEWLLTKSYGLWFYIG